MQKGNRQWSDAALEAAIRGTPGERDAALMHLFRSDDLQEQVRKYVVTHGGTDADGEDVFQDAFVLFDRNVRQGRYNGQSKLSTYFFAIAKWHWVTLSRKRRPTVEIGVSAYDAAVPPGDMALIAEDHQSVLHQALTLVGDTCKKLLLLAGVAASNEEIARDAGYGSADMAKKAVYRCRERFRQIIREQPSLETLLKSMLVR